MTGIGKIQSSAQAGLRNLAASLVRSEPSTEAPHKRHRRMQDPRDKLSCMLADMRPEMALCYRQYRHAHKPKHAK